MGNSAVIGVLALQGDVREHAHSVEAAGGRVRLVRRAVELEGLDGLIIPGGESTTMVKLLTVFDVWDALKSTLASGLPVYGSCAGMIMLATEVVDGISGQPGLGVMDISVRRNAFGRQTESFEADMAIPVLGEPPMRAVFIRAPWVERVGDDVEVLASIADDAGVHPVAVRQGTALATSFHPEVTGDRRIHRLFLDMVEDHRSGASGHR